MGPSGGISRNAPHEQAEAKAYICTPEMEFENDCPICDSADAEDITVQTFDEKQSGAIVAVITTFRARSMNPTHWLAWI